MLTGDSEDSAQAVGKDAGIDEIYAKLLPEDKLNALKKVRQAHGTVMFVGDGINDAPVLAGADVGAAMGSGADAAIEAADAVFMNSNVDAIPQSIAIARSTNRIAWQNVIFALVIKIVSYDPWSCRTCQHVDGRICRHWRCHDLRAEFHSYPV